MNVMNLVEQGVELMLLGMGMVFFILCLLIIVIKATSALILKHEPATVSHDTNLNGFGKIHEDIVAAITIAVQRHHSK